MTRITRLNPVLTELDVVGYVGITIARNGTTDDRSALASADTAALAAGKPLVLLPGVHRVASTLTINSPMVMQPGAIIKPDSGITVTLAGGVSASPVQRIADHSAGGLVVPKAVPYYHPGWWGPIGTSDDSATWLAMKAAIEASVVTVWSEANFGQKVMAPVGVNRILGVELKWCDIYADKGSTCFCPPNGTTSGTVLTLGDWASIRGGYFRTSETTQAVTLLWQKGYRAHSDSTFIEVSATNATGLKAGQNSGTQSPVINNLFVRYDNSGTPYSGSVGLDVQTPDIQASNIRISWCDIGIKGTLAGQGHWSNVHVFSNNTGISGRWDGCHFNNVYLDSNFGWGMNLDHTYYFVAHGIYCWNNGAGIASTGGIRISTDSGSSRRGKLRGVVLNDNVGTGLLLTGTCDQWDVECVLTKGSAAVVTTTGVQIDSGVTNTRLGLVGSDATTALVNSSTSTSKTFPTGDVVGTTDTQNLTNKSLTTPTISTPSILDANGNKLLGFSSAAGAVNYISLLNASGVTPTITADGTGANVNVAIRPKGSGHVAILSGPDGSKGIQIDVDTLLSTGSWKSVQFPDSNGVIVLRDYAQTLLNKTLTTPVISTPSILDANGNTLIGFGTTASAVNYLKFVNASGATPILTADGSGSNVNVAVQGKGTGKVVVVSGADSTKGVQLDVDTLLSTGGWKNVQFPDSNGVLVLRDYAQTLLAKTLTSPKITSGNAPASASATGAAGQVEWDSGYIYVCTATNTWKRAAIATW